MARVANIVALIVGAIVSAAIVLNGCVRVSDGTDEEGTGIVWYWILGE